jgi:hypothetical protein
MQRIMVRGQPRQKHKPGVVVLPCRLSYRGDIGRGWWSRLAQAKTREPI